MKTEWDYSDLAKAYLKRPDYSDDAINEMMAISSIKEGDFACDVGAGVAHLTLMLLNRRLRVNSVEPNDEMRKYGKMRTEGINDVTWFEGTGEETGQDTRQFDIVTFGSSFNVTDRQKALIETARIAKNKGWFAAMWNHRDLKDPIQKEIEEIIKSNIEGYDYGTRRADQTDEINKSSLFGNVHKIEGSVMHEQTAEELVEAWRSHATLQRQAGDNFYKIIEDIERMIQKNNLKKIPIPYTTRVWLAQLKN
jgi:ubiquinone/menaquinone biosynthesis C-methylase UbiE